MWEKIKMFFTNKTVKIVEWIILAIVMIGLIIGGATTDTITGSVALVGGIVGAVALFIKFISDNS